MRVTVVGLGYVGLVTGACLAEWDHDVVGVDADPRRLATLREGRVPFHEPRLPELVADGISKGTLSFTDDLKGSTAAADMVIVAVGTHDGNGGWQTDTVRGALADIVPAMADSATLVDPLDVAARLHQAAPVARGQPADDRRAVAHPGHAQP